ncbi:MAG: nicotinate (nicotinamide) nucleotide adenylyltransferase [Eubacterium sp.]|nr:nicotinate (nicotinamide) nucleotide adenylyltransferase [Eubacterium sp.]
MGNNKSSIAILGGSFNPVHSGHLAMARAAHDFASTDVILMPNKTTYYKETKPFVADQHRIGMLQAAIKGFPYMRISLMEIERGGITHTIDTIRAFKEEYPLRTVYFIIGGDSLEWVDRWVDADELLQKTYFLVAIRGKTDRLRSLEIIERIKSEHPDSNMSLLTTDNIPISSTDIRERIRLGESIKGLVPEGVEEYIYTNNLYKEVK